MRKAEYYKKTWEKGNLYVESDTVEININRKKELRNLILTEYIESKASRVERRVNCQMSICKFIAEL